MIDHPDRDSLRIDFTGKLTPALVRYQLRDASGSEIELPVLDDDYAFSFTIPYTSGGNYIDRYVVQPGGGIIHQFNGNMLFEAGS